MRSLLYKFCVNNNFNLSTAYGVENECQNIPFSCHSGQKLFFLYGHDREPFIKRSSSSSSLKITMLRDPLSWLTSRIQHEMRKNKKLQLQQQSSSAVSWTNAIIQFGPKYFNFFDDSTRDLALKVFHRLVKSSSLSSLSGPAIVSPLSMDSSYITLLTRIENLFQQEIFILQNSYYSESLDLLSKLFDSNFLNQTSSASFPSSTSQPRLNEAFESQETSSMGSLSDIKRLNILLELHNQIYYLSLKEFLRQRGNLIKPSRVLDETSP
jgi:hypothetical protein